MIYPWTNWQSQVKVTKTKWLPKDVQISNISTDNDNDEVDWWHVLELMVAWQDPPVEDKNLNKVPTTLLPQHFPTGASFKPFF